jgi:purine-binding chemotaxis protein CheW
MSSLVPRADESEEGRWGYLLCRVGASRVALPVVHIVETMRPMAIEPVPHVPSFVLGVAIVRGAPVPVVDAGLLMGTAQVASGRWVTLRVADRSVALAVEGVQGVQDLSHADFDALPPLFAGAAADAVAALGTLDAQLLVILQMSRLLPESAWQTFASQGGIR